MYAIILYIFKYCALHSKNILYNNNINLQKNNCTDITTHVKTSLIKNNVTYVYSSVPLSNNLTIYIFKFYY